jgi:hypothetical protein
MIKLQVEYQFFLNDGAHAIGAIFSGNGIGKGIIHSGRAATIPISPRIAWAY